MEHPYLDNYALKQNSILLDLGATCGDFAQEILPMLKATNSKIYCVEPEKTNFERLATWCRTVAPAHCIPIWGCTTYHDGTTKLTVTDQALLHHVADVPKQKWDYVEAPGYEVPAYTLKTLIESIGGHVDFIKCDIEGGEIDTFCMNPEWVPLVDNLAIAAYHVVGGARTWKALSYFLDAYGYEVILRLEPEKDDRDMVYAWRKR